VEAAITTRGGLEVCGETQNPPAEKASEAHCQALDVRLTKLCFYLTQVYGHLGCPGFAARYIERLLCRQLGGGGEGELDKLEWAKNSLRLGSFHLARKNWAAVAACIRSAEAMLRNMEELHVSMGSSPSHGSAPQIEPRQPPGEASELLSSPLRLDGSLDSLVREVNLGGEVDSFKRVQAETLMHWGQLWEALLQAGISSPPPPASSSSSSSSGNQALEGVQGKSVGGSSSIQESSTASSDPFSTLPLVDFGGQSLSSIASPWRGENTLDAVNVEDSDHDADTRVLASRVGYGGSGQESGERTLFRNQSMKEDLTTFTRRYLPPPLSPTAEVVSIPRDFSSARVCFLAAQSAYLGAMEYFVLDGFVSEHRGATEGLAACWGYLSAFEPDPRRKGAMLARKGELLGALSQQLSFSVYRDVVRRLSWDAGMAWIEAMDARSQGGKGDGGKGGAAAAKSVNAACDAALLLLNRFLGGYRDPRFPEQPLCMVGGRNSEAPPCDADLTSVSEEEEERWALAHFFSTRALFRRNSAAAAERLEDTRSCLERATWLQQAVGKLGVSTRSRLEECMRLVQDLVEVLPQKLAVMSK